MSESISGRLPAPLVGLASPHPPLDRCSVPVTFGLPLPRGACHDAAAIGACDPIGAPLPLQTQALERWPDGSIRWVLCDLRLDARDDPALGRLGPGLARNATALPPISTSHVADGLTIGTGAARIDVGSNGPVLCLFRRPGGTQTAVAELSIAADGTHDLPVVFHDAAIEQSGPLRTVVRLTGRALISRRVRLEIVARLHAFAGLGALRCQLTIRNPHRARHAGGHWDLGDPGSILIGRATLRLEPRTPPTDPVLRCSLAPGQPLTRAAVPFSIHQASSGGDRWQSRNHVTRTGAVPLPFRGYRTNAGGRHGEGLRATPIVVAGPDEYPLGLTVEHFWQNFPMEIASDGHRIDLHLLPPAAEPHELQGGEQKTWDVWMQAGRDPVTAEPLAWARDPLLVASTPEYYASTGAVRYLTPEAADAHPAYVALVRSAVDGEQSFARKREIVDEFGWRHFGDIYGDHEGVRHHGPEPLVSHYNNQYDPVAGFALQFFRSTSRSWWSQMCELASHVADIDIYHTDEDKAAYNRGLFWHTIHYIDADTATHRTYPRSCGHGGGPASEHNYASGLMLAWFLTGDARYREAALDLAGFPIRIDDGSRTVFRWLARGDTGLATASGRLDYQGPGRGSGNSLSALVDGYRLTGDRAYLDKAEQIIRRVVHPRDDIAARDLLDAERKWFYTMFLQALGKYLDEKAERGQIDGMYAWGQASLLHYARWMADHEYPYLDKPEILEFPTETWAAQDIRKSDVFDYARHHAADSGERERFAERARFFFDRSVAALTASPTAHLARPVVVLLTSGFMHDWCERHPDHAAPAVATQVNTNPPRPFEPQRIRALRRARFGTAVAAAAVLAGVVVLGWTLLVLLPGFR